MWLGDFWPNWRAIRDGRVSPLKPLIGRWRNGEKKNNKKMAMPMTESLIHQNECKIYRHQLRLVGHWKWNAGIVELFFLFFFPSRIIINKQPKHERQFSHWEILPLRILPNSRIKYKHISFISNWEVLALRILLNFRIKCKHISF